MAHKALVQQFAQHILHAAAEVGAEAVGEQKGGTGGNGACKRRIWRTGETDGSKFGIRGLFIQYFLTPVVISVVINAYML